MRIAVAQFAPVNGDVPANLGRIRALATEAATADAVAVVFSECQTTGYAAPEAMAALCEPVDGRTGSSLAATAKECGLAVAAGVAELDPVPDGGTGTESLTTCSTCVALFPPRTPCDPCCRIT